MFGEIIIQTLAGNSYIEDQPRMLLQNPTMNAYWNDRRARLERIQVPAYIVASYTNPAHTSGTLEGVDARVGPIALRSDTADPQPAPGTVAQTGQIVPVDIPLWPMAMLFNAGEEIELTIAPFLYPGHIPFSFGHVKVPVPAKGYTFAPGSKPQLRMLGGPAEASATRLATKPPRSGNKGRHIIHAG